jgi:hypothetical protein
VDPSVGAVDLEVTTRVQDSDHPDSALLPGGSNAWTGQTIMSQTASSPIRANPFPSLNSVSAWGTFSSNSSSVNAGGAGDARDAQHSTSPQTRNQTLDASVWSKLTGSRKQYAILAGVELQPTRSNRSIEEFSIDQNEASDPHANMRMLKRATQKTARLRIVNPFQNKADAATARRWSGSLSSARALEQNRHEEALLLKSGFNAQTQRRRHLKRGKTPTSGSR